MEPHEQLFKEYKELYKKPYEKFYTEPCTKSLITSVKRSWTRSLQ